jgi:hypothetical protein
MSSCTLNKKKVLARELRLNGDRIDASFATMLSFGYSGLRCEGDKSSASNETRA